MKESNRNRYLQIENIECEEDIVRCFESIEGDFLPLYSNETKIGFWNLDDFCENNELVVTEKLEKDLDGCSEEYNVLQKLLGCNDLEIDLIKRKIIDEYSKGCVLCCTSFENAKKISNIIMKDHNYKIKYIHSVLELNANDNVIFLEFKKIKLYRKCHKAKIHSFLMLDSVIKEVKNQIFFEKNYPDLFDYFEQIGVEYIYATIPEGDELISLSDSERDRISGWKMIDYDLYKTILGIDSSDYKACMLQKKENRVINNGIYNELCDYTSEYYNVTNGMRCTRNQPEVYSNKIFLMGPCTVRGALVGDDHTIASMLQSQLNESGLKYLVLNCGVGGGTNLENTYKYVLSLPLKSGDVVVMIEEGKFLRGKNSFENIINLSDAFNKRNIECEWFLDRPAHCGAYGNRVISQSIFNQIIKRNYISKKQQYTDIPHSKIFTDCIKVYENKNELNDYLKYIKSKKFHLKGGECAGAIVMHGNPMTIGHKYLIDTALHHVDYLYVFVLSEDRSKEDKFELPAIFRKQLIMHETSIFNNVRVMDGGNVVASTRTFPEYFEKGRNQCARIDASKDIFAFCQHVAPTLEITKRFVGTENRDFVTRQYNNQLKMILPYYGIDIVEIERIQNNGKDISAYSVRKLISKGMWIDVHSLVSDYVYNKLREFYHDC